MDFYIWGNNCRLLDIPDDTCIDFLDETKNVTRDQRDDFWEGKVNGTIDEVIPITQ